jgi:hypothetical protein
MTHKTIRVLLLPEKDRAWVAQCLEYDIASQGTSIDDALINFVQVFCGQISRDLERNIAPLSTKSEAPHWYWQILKTAEPLKNERALKMPRKARLASKRAASLQSILPFVLA